MLESEGLNMGRTWFEIALLPGSTPAFQSSVVGKLGGAWGQAEFERLLIPK